MARRLRSNFVHGPAGRLEILHETPTDSTRTKRVVVVCHPHPLHGGSMHNKVVFRLARAARRAEAAVVRFQFRGVGLSDGSYDEGRGEQDDLRAVLSYASESYPGLPVGVIGFSFGARVGRVLVVRPHVRRPEGVGVPGPTVLVERLAEPEREVPLLLKPTGQTLRRRGVRVDEVLIGVT